MKRNRRIAMCLTLLFSCHSAKSEEENILVIEQRSTHINETSTATRTMTPLKLIPQTVDSVYVDQATAFGQPTLSEALSGVPGVNASGDTRFDNVKIRGFSAGNDLLLDGFRDDMQYTRDLSNIERIDVLKGPAAVLYGRGSSGGIINRISKKPQKGKGSKVTTQIGEYGFKRLHADINHDLDESTIFRFNVAQEKANSFRHGVSRDKILLAPSGLWKITPRLNGLLQYDYQSSKRTPDRGIPAVNGRPANVAIGSVYSDTENDYIHDRFHSLRSRLNYELNLQWQLRHLLMFSSLNSQFDNTYVTGVSGDNVRRARWQQDLHAKNISSNLEAEGLVHAGAFEHQLLIGTEQSWQNRNPKLYRNNRPFPIKNLFAPEKLRQQHDGNMLLASHSRHQVRNSAFYLQNQMAIDDWHLVASLRGDRFHVTSNRYDRNLQESRNNNNISPRLGVVWQPVAAHALYTSFSKTYAPVGGGLIGITPENKNNRLSPEYTRQFETGVKSDWLEQQVTTTLSLYRLEMYNRRTRDPENPDILQLTGQQRTDGLELSMNANLTANLYLRGGMALQNASFLKAEEQFQGKRPNNVSRRNGELYIGYRDKSGWLSEAGVTAVSKRFADNQNTTALPGYQRYDVRIGYGGKRWDLQLSAENVLDNRYYLSATSAAQIQPGSPRQINLSASYRF